MSEKKRQARNVNTITRRKFIHHTAAAAASTMVLGRAGRISGKTARFDAQRETIIL